MIDILYAVLGILVFVWYLGVRWTFCATETWIFNPINFTTALISIFFIVPTLFLTTFTFGKVFLCLAIFLLFRNFYYLAEDIIDYGTSPTPRQFVYISVDCFMICYVVCWMLQYYRS